MLPPQRHNHPDGYFFDRDERDQVRLNLGSFGLVAIGAHHQAAAAIASSGVDLILDEVILSEELFEDWKEALAGLDVFWVGVHCDLTELERREIARGDRVHGQARGQLDIIHQFTKYDFEVDTAKTSPEHCASQVLRAKALL